MQKEVNPKFILILQISKETGKKISGNDHTFSLKSVTGRLAGSVTEAGCKLLALHRTLFKTLLHFRAEVTRPPRKHTKPLYLVTRNQASLLKSGEGLMYVLICGMALLRPDVSADHLLVTGEP